MTPEMLCCKRLVRSLVAAMILAGALSPGGGVEATPPPGGLVCPVRGPVWYTNSWGAPRPDGRRHEGVDLMAPMGTPLVAVASGRVSFGFNRLGGRVAWVHADDGTRHYYAHLSRIAGFPRRVRAGDVIGYVGMTGNAGAPHLHWEVHPGGGAAVNPYPYAVRARC